jgi:hypothetical protein
MDVVHNKALSVEGLQTIMPMNSVPPVQSTSQSDVDALAHGLNRWAHYPVTAQRAHELATEFAQLNASVQAGAANLRCDDEPSSYVAWLTAGTHRG